MRAHGGTYLAGVTEMRLPVWIMLFAAFGSIGR